MQRQANYYSATLNDDRQWPALDGDLRVDVAIIGGGFTGVGTALALSERGYRVALLEAHRIGWGASGRNGGQVTGSLSGDDAMRRQLRRHGGVEAVSFVDRLRWQGHDIIESRIRRYDIDCDLKRGHLHAAWSPRHVETLKRGLDAAANAGIADAVEWLEREAVHERLDTPLYHGALLNRRNLHLHSLKLCVGEAQAASSLGAELFENTNVERIEHGQTPTLHTAGGRVRADAIVLAGNAYHRLAPRRFAGRLFPAVLGNLVTEPLDAKRVQRLNPQDLAVYDSRVVLDYYRLTADNRLMFGGGTNYSGRSISDVDRVLRPALESTFPSLAGIGIDYSWTCTAGIVLNRIPMLGRLADGVYYAQGYSGHGIATSHVLGEFVAEAIAGELEHFDIFSAFEHPRLPGGERLGGLMLALGMAGLQLKERLAG